MTEYILSADTTKIILIFALAFACQVFVLRPVLFSVLDSLSVYLFFNSFSIAFVAYLFVDNEINVFYVTSFLLCNMMFVLGILSGNKKINQLQKIDMDFIRENSFKSERSNFLTVLLIFAVVTAISTNLFLFLATGTLPLLADDADSAKVLLRQGGLGIVYRVNDAILPLGISTALLKTFPPISSHEDRNPWWRLLGYIVLVLLLLLFISGGSKSSIISLLGILVPLQVIGKLFKSRNQRVINTLILYSLPCSLLLAIIVFWKNYISTGYLDVSSGILVRLIASGDAFYYFYKYDLLNKFNLGFFKYLYDTVNPLLSLLKISTYETSVGEKLLQESINLTTGGFGPNAPYPVYGLMYFGAYGSLVFSFFVGWIVSWIRVNVLVGIVKKPTELGIVAYMVLFFHIHKLPTDYIMVLTSLYTSLVLLLPLFVVSKVFTRTKLSA